jgi:iron complex transport system substrate-binding protein
VQPSSASASAAAGYPRIVKDKYGEVEITAKPERILAYYANSQLDALLALGVKPALIMTYQGFDLAPWQSGAKDVSMVFFTDGMINYEKVLADKIDLIITAEYPTTTQAARDDRVANKTDIPVISLDQADFEEQLRIVGDIFGLENEAAAKIAEMQALFADFKPARVPATVKAFGNYEDGKFWMYREASGLGAMLKRFGLPALSTPTTVGDQNVDPEAVQAISFEAMTELDADLLIGTDFGQGYRVSFVSDSPLFKQLPVAKEGRYVVFDQIESQATCYGSILSIPTAKAALTKVLEQYAAAALPAAEARTAAAATSRDALIAEGIAKAQAFTPALTPAEVTSEHRLIKQGAFGDAKVPLAPKRIVTLDPSLTDTVIALGYSDAIVGTIVDYNGDVFHEHVAGLLKPGTAKLGQEGSPNLERVVAAKPDLILTWDWYPDNIAQLQQIAPTVVMPYSTYEQGIGQTYSNEQYVTWLVREVAAVLGLDERVDAALQPFRGKKAAGRVALAAALGDQKVGFVDIRKEKILLSGYGSDGISALLYGDLGVRPDPLTDALYVWEDLSLEKVPELTADLMLAFVDGDDAKQRYDELTRNPLWQKVPAVKNGKVFIVPSGLYYRGDDGPLGAARVVDDIVLKLTGKPL